MAQLAFRGVFRSLRTKNVASVMSCRNHSTEWSSSVSQKLELTLEETVDFSIHGPSEQGIQGGHDDHLEISEPAVQTNIASEAEEREVADTLNCQASVNLYSSMQSNVPEPFDCKIDHAEHFNMPGGGVRLYDKYIQEIHVASHPRDK